ncbi:MAG: lytic transglycosylase [Rhizobiales bacterium]|nr:lytic transglycosylase [Hyphomicrobiales bacterium]
MKDAPRRLRNPCMLATLAVALIWLGTAARAMSAAPPEPLAFPESQLEPLDWAAIEGWLDDDHASAFATFQASCKPLVASRRWRRSKKPADTRPMRQALTDVCVEGMKALPADGAAAREFFEAHFRPVQVGQLGEETGLLTGYYEPIVEGSRFPSHEYVVPVYAPPSDLIAFGRRAEGGAFPNRGRVGRRVGPDEIVPYHDRGEIEEGVLAGQGLEICWIKDPIDAFVLQIQGSARIKLDTGKTMRLNYAAHNGHPYTSVGRILIQRGLVPKAEMSMDRIREWMQTNTDEGKDLRRENRSYVFMRETGLADDVEPTGAQGVSLTPGRSIAVDRKLHVYGTPFFISADLPIGSEQPATPFRQLMVAQDTGSAIVGLARADIYFGAGEEPGRIAGRIKQQGRFVMLVPRAIDPAIAAANAPLPPPRPPEPKFLPPEWLWNVASAATAPAPSLPSTEAAVAAAASPANAYAAPAPAVPLPQRTARVRTVPLPKPRPQGLVRVRR